MDLKAEILKEHSKKQTQKIVSWVGNDVHKFDDLMQLFLNDEYRVVQRSAWMVSECCNQNPSLILPYLKDIISYLSKPNIHDAVKRNILRILQYIDVPDEFLGELTNISFGFLENQNEAIAIRAFSMSVLANCVVKYPELKNELLALIDMEFEKDKVMPAFASKAKHIRKKLG